MTDPDRNEGGEDNGETAVQASENESAVDEQTVAQPPPAHSGYWDMAKGLMMRALIIYFISSFFRSSPPAATNDGKSVAEGGVPVKLPATNIFMDGTPFDLYVYMSERETFDFSSPAIWFEEDLKYGDFTGGPSLDGIYIYHHTFEPSENLQNNGSIYIHSYIVKSGFSANPKQRGKFEIQATMYQSQMLNKFRKRKFEKTSNLITGKTQLTDDEIRKAEAKHTEITSHWHPNITINIVHDFTNWAKGGVPPPLDQFVTFTPAGDEYQPILFLNTYWNLYREYIPINNTVKQLNLTLTFQPLSLFKWQMYATQTMKNKWPGAALLDGLNDNTEDDESQDALKEMFLETSPYLLALTGIVSLLHSVFEMLAFKNDVQFWNNRRSLEGLSVRSVFFNVFQSLIVLLYVCDNETNFVIKFSCFIGLGIELWKITKVMDISVNKEKRILGIPTLSCKDRGTYIESKTKKFDELAFRYLGMLFFPLLGCYVVYSLIYHEHKGWYSFVLSMLYGFLLTFGFIMMTPQLFINYKMKSVAHLPWRMLTYKALNTFIDDIFAFVIKMPIMYRLGTLRDDVIFFIFLYQKYIYPIDPKRVNEFGFSQEEFESKNKGKDAKTPKLEGTEAKTSTLEDKDAPAKSIKDKKKD